MTKSGTTTLKEYFQGLNIKTRLILAFLVLIIMMAGAGCSGLIFIMTIKNHVSTLSDIASPLSRISGSLTGRLDRAHITALNLLTIKDDAGIPTLLPELDACRTGMEKDLTELERISKAGGLPLDISSLRRSGNDFFEQIHEAMAAHTDMRRIQDLKNGRILAAEEQRHDLESALTVFVEASQSIIGRKEDLTRKLAMIPETTVKELVDLSLEVFEVDLYLLNNGLQLRTFLAQLQDLLKSYLSEQDMDQLTKHREAFESLANVISSRLKRMQWRLNTEEQKKAFQDLTRKLETFKQGVLEPNGIFDLHRAFLEAGRTIQTMQSRFSKATDNVGQTLADVLETSDTINRKIQADTRKSVNAALIYIGLIVVIGVCIGGLAAFWIIQAITRPLLKLQTTVQEVEQTSAYAIRVHSTGTDEVGRTAMAFDSLMDALQAVITEIHQVMAGVASGDFSRHVTSEQKGDLLDLKNSVNDSIRLLGRTLSEVTGVSSALIHQTEELSGTARTLSQNTGDQAHEIERIAKGMNSISDRAQENEHNALEVQTISHQAIQAAHAGNLQVERMVDAMKTIENTSTRIFEAIAMINDIASRTKLLALNASIEAVRAGSAGKGFAVVAEEVRTLADNSANAASQTEELIRQSSLEIEKGGVNAAQTAEVLEQINTIVEKVNQLVKDISVSSVAQSADISEINKSLSDINDAVLRNSDIARSNASAYNDLTAMARNMSRAMEKFRLP